MNPGYRSRQITNISISRSRSGQLTFSAAAAPDLAIVGEGEEAENEHPETREVARARAPFL